MPRRLQDEIHCETSASQSVWEAYRSDVSVFLSEKWADIGNHLVREFNRKVYNLGLFALMLSPFDDGFRYSPNGEEVFFILSSDGSDRMIRPEEDNETENIIGPDETLYNVTP